MKIEFDLGKDQLNRLKHGMSLAAAADMHFDDAIVVPDRRRAYGEDRFQAVGMIGGRLHVLALTMRNETLAGDIVAQGEHERDETLWTRTTITRS